jgi:EAL domain-containing protein (putative c-di-GMP-specific phosphodiesterase class I)
MRIWETDSSNVLPSDLVREQDFILRVRRMQRHGVPCLVLNLVLNAIEPLAKNRGAFEAVQKQLQEFAAKTKGFYFEMSNGDVFIEWEETKETHILSEKIVDAIMPEHKNKSSQFLLTFRMPVDYTSLRERTDHYVALVRSTAIVNADGAGRIEGAQGGLTAKYLDQIGQMLGEIDLRRYGRSQNIYRHVAGKWQIQGEEYFISFEDLRRERFPKLDVVYPEHFFLALCGMLDQKLLAQLTTSYELIGGRRINLNLSITSIVGTVFTQFVRRVPQEHRALIGFEIHRGDLLQDFSLTLNAIETLKKEGFRIALDSITPDMVNYIDLAAFNVESIKINVSKDRAMQLTDPAIRTGLERLPSDQLIFFRCDNERALSVGLEMGVKMFQGWLIDDIVSKKN